MGNEAVDAAGQAVFDEFHLLKGDNIFGKLNELKEICEKKWCSRSLYAKYWDGFNHYFCK